MKLNIFYTTKEMASKLKRLLTERDNLSSYTANNGLITRIYRELKTLNSQKNQ
jgi:hypothetical protein